MTTKVAIVTGAGSGIGRATTQRFVSENVAVVASDRNSEGLAETLALCGNRTDLVTALTQDVTAKSAPEDAVKAALQTFGRLDILVNNAGIGAAKAAHDTSDEDWQRYVDINMTAVFRYSREVLKAFPSEGGAIVNIASVFGIFGPVKSAPYSATKAAVIGITRQMAADYGPKGIRVNAVAPGLIATPLTKARFEKDRQFMALSEDVTPFPRLGRPEDIADAIFFLASDRAGFINGHILAVDGGWSSTNYSRRAMDI
ncbi:MAG: SDR family NAD(P)-dependent oxidoreductase [Hyphomicrobiaceae bacterium]|jgi:NAD(P)-dependent dehydrogenase (short-subunit alcohol dehydrogenase family)